MNPKQKKWLSIGLAVGGVGIWIPQLLVGVVETPGEPKSFEPAFMDEAEEGRLAGTTTPGAVPGAAVPVTAPGAESPGGGGSIEARPTSLGAAASSGSSSLAEALLALREQALARQSSRVELNLDDLLSADEPEVQGESEQAPTEAPAPRIVRLPVPTPVRDLLGEVAESLVLQGILFDSEDPVALADGALLHEGDELASGVVLKHIGRRAVVLARNGREREVRLPAFQPRPVSSDSSDSSDSPSSEPSEDVSTSEESPVADNPSDSTGESSTETSSGTSSTSDSTQELLDSLESLTGDSSKQEDK